VLQCDVDIVILQRTVWIHC